jgi:hypothetical protein
MKFTDDVEEHWENYTKLHSIASQKMILFIAASMTTSNLTEASCIKAEGTD